VTTVQSMRVRRLVVLACGLTLTAACSSGRSPGPVEVAEDTDPTSASAPFGRDADPSGRGAPELAARDLICAPWPGGLFSGDAAWLEAIVAPGEEPLVAARDLAVGDGTETASFRIWSRSAPLPDAEFVNAGASTLELVGQLSHRTVDDPAVVTRAGDPSAATDPTAATDPSVATDPTAATDSSAPGATDGAPEVRSRLAVGVIEEIELTSLTVASATRDGEDTRVREALEFDRYQGAVMRGRAGEATAVDWELCMPFDWTEKEGDRVYELVFLPLTRAFVSLPTEAIGSGGEWTFSLAEQRLDWGSQSGQSHWRLDHFDGEAFTSRWELGFVADVDSPRRHSRTETTGRVAARLDRWFPVASTYDETVESWSGRADERPADADVRGDRRRVELLAP